MTLCAACGNEIQGKSVRHHKSYFPEVTVQVHRSCHRRIHGSDAYPHLRPSEYDALKFYGATSEYENIPVLPETKQRINSLGHKGETYDEIISRLVSRVNGESI